VIGAGLRHGLLPALLLSCAAAAAQEPQMATRGSVAYACGGVGAEERRAMRTLEAHANLELLFVTAKRGGYLAGAQVVIRNADGKQLELTADGPVCLLLLPAGTYEVTAMLGAVVRSAKVAVSAPTGKPRRLALAFPGEAWDGIWASPEEKRQARE